MEPESQTAQPLEVRPGVGDPASQICEYVRVIERVACLSQEEYNHLKYEGDHLRAAKVESHLATIKDHVRSTIHLIHSATMNELGRDGSADRQQHHNYGSRLQKALLDAASANRACDQARRQIGDLQAQLAAANEQLNRVDSLKCCICHDSFVTKQSSCGHLFCEDCIDNWANTLSYPTPSEEARGNTEETRKVLFCPVCKQDTAINNGTGRV